MKSYNKIPTLRLRPRDAHKGGMGRVLVIAGCLRMPGAAFLAGQAASRAGAGLVTIACAEPLLPVLGAKVTVQTLLPLIATTNGVIKKAAVREIVENLGRFDAVALGPGLSAESDAQDFVRNVLLRIDKPLVLDADGLNAIVNDPGIVKKRDKATILTPHPGEAARLLGVQDSEERKKLQQDRRDTALRLVKLTGGVILLKGAETIVTDGSRIYINHTGNPGMATGGTGDVLTGIAAALLARGMDAFEAAVLAAHVHGRAGDLAAGQIGEDGMLATDILERIPAAIRERIRRRSF
ncbi:MAG: NAD(P)H-hydrate dehydratase [Planctomycetota bacterium]